MMTTRQLSWLRAAAAITAALLTVQFNRAQTVPPLEIQAPRTNQVQLLWPASTNFTILQEGLEVADPGAWVDVPEAPEVLGTRCSVLRESTNSAAYYRLVNRHGADPSAPPDPAATATAPLPNVYNDLASLTAFLYTGSNAIQVGVAPGTIKSTQASVLRGRVLQRDTSPLPGVRVVILGHPEYGYTYTRTDGRFDLAVNAAVYTVDYQAAGYCPAQRQVTLLALAYGVAPDVILVPQDALATSVQFGANAPPQVATSSPQADAAGTRSATMFIPSGTEAAMVMADGWLQPVASLTFRITEFTVGTDGPKAMPAALPPNSGYTYCADFSADEAVNAGANSIRFSRPVPVYVDNFLGVPVGTLMPVGYYDRGQGVWVPCPNGIVLQVLGSAEGAALVDLHGTGEAERADTLAANGFTTEELQHLATVYPAGKTLWRCPVPHCSSIDFNLGFSTPDSDRPTPGDKPKGKPQDTTPDRYGALHFSAQTFTERIPLAGAPFALNYASARVPDYRVDSQVTIPVAWQPPRNPCVNGSGCLQTELDPHYFDPPSAIQVEAHVEGQQSLRSLPPTNQVATVSWDGRDAYGRLVGGTRLANITISYVYSAWSYFGVSFGSGLLDQFPALFGNAGNMVSFAGHTDTEIRVGAVFQRLLTYPDHRKLGLGGWSPNPLHRLDPAGGILYYGDGRIRTVPQASVLDDFLSALGGRSRLVAAAPDGTLYFYGNYGPTGEARLFRRKPASGFEGLSVTWGTPGAVDVARDGWAKADGLPADRVVVDVSVSSLKAGPDGSLYLTDNRVIARLAPDLIWHVIMGRNATLPAILQPDGTPASESFATWANNALLAVGPDNSVYYSSWWPSYAPTAYGTNYTMVRKIASDGRIYTVFGGGGVAATNGSPSFKALFGASAQDAHYANGWGVCGLAVGEDGVVYVSEDEINTRGIFRISLGGIVLPFLNGGPGCAEGMFDPNPADTNLTTRIKGDQGKLAIDVTDPASIPTCLQVAQDGSVYFTDGTFVWRVAPNGAVERVAGRYSQSASPPPNLPIDNGDPLNTYIYPVSDMALRSDGTLFLQRGVGNVVPATYVIPGRSALGGTLASAVSYSIPSEDASEVYVFDQFGRHLRTLDGLTGAPKWVFDYDAQSLVVSLTDAVGQVTRIERDAAGQATAIVNPYGQRTGLAMDANGFLSAVTNPAGETTRLSNSTGGLLRTITGPLGETYTVDYDELGQVIKVADPLGGGWVDSWVDKGVLEDYSYEVDINCTNSLGDTLSRRLLLEPNADTNVYSSLGGYPTETAVWRPSGDCSRSFGDGSTLYTGLGADPRFGNQAKQPAQRTLSLPNGPVCKVSVQRTAGLTNSADPFSLKGLTNVTTINGKSYTQVYSPTDRTLTSTSPLGRTGVTALDGLGRPVRLSAPGQAPLAIVYDAAGRVAAVTNRSSIGPQATTFAYNDLGQLVTVTDPSGRAGSFAYDDAGRVQQQTLPDGTIVKFTFDSEDRVTSLTPPERPAHTFEYNAVGLLTKYTPPPVGFDPSISYQYDTERRLTQAIFPDGQKFAVQRGLAGRVESLTLGAGETLSYAYGGVPGSGYLRLTNISSTSGNSLQLNYAGPILTNLRWWGTVTGRVSVQLNADLLPSSHSVNNSTIPFAYNADRLLTQAGALALARDPLTGFIVGTTLGDLTDERSFDDRGLLTNYAATLGGTSVWSIALSYNLINQLTNKVETVGGVTRAFDYAYDLGGRLERVWRDGALAAAYSYDAIGNRLTRDAESASYDAQDRLTAYGAKVFDWSPNGTLQSQTESGQTTTYHYDLRGHLTGVGLPDGRQVSYVLDPAGHRIAKLVNGAFQRGWLWSGPTPAAEVNANSVVTAQFVFASRPNVPDYILKGPSAYRVLTDERGSVRLVINITDGTIAQQLDYDEFGRVLLDSNPGFQPLALPADCTIRIADWFGSVTVISTRLPANGQTATRWDSAAAALPSTPMRTTTRSISWTPSVPVPGPCTLTGMGPRCWGWPAVSSPSLPRSPCCPRN